MQVYPRAINKFLEREVTFVTFLSGGEGTVFKGVFYIASTVKTKKGGQDLRSE